MWNIVIDPIRDWLTSQDRDTVVRIRAALEVLAQDGPNLKRPLVGKIESSTIIKNLKELRPPSPIGSTIRILFTFDPNRNAIMLVGGDKQRQWNKWYPKAIREAEKRYLQWLEQQAKESQ